MKSKIIIIGAIATVAVLGAGILIPRVIGTKDANNQEGMAVVEEKQELDDASNAEFSLQDPASVTSDQNNSFNTDKEDSKSAIIDFNLDSDSMSINGMAIKSIDYTKMLESLGGSENPYVNYHPVGSSDNCAIDAIAQNGKVINLHEDGYYHNETGAIIEPVRKFLRVFNGDGVMCEYDYWCENGRSMFKVDTYHVNSPSKASADEISTFCNLPFIYGTYEDMNSIFHTDEIMSLGEKEDIGNGYVKYKFKNSKGNSISMNYNKTDEGRSTYLYSVGGVEIQITFYEGGEMSDSANYIWNMTN